MTDAMRNELRAARLFTLERIRAEVFTDDGVTLKLRAPVLCSRSIHGPQKHREHDGSVRTSL